MTVFAKWWGSRSMWFSSYWPDGAITRLHVWLDGDMTVGMYGAGIICVGHGGMLGVFILGGAEEDGILGDREAVGTIRYGGAVGASTLGSGAGKLYQRVIGGVVG